ncbi:MAG: metallophosphoesterase [Chloroflexi bacterium]|nr:MAG: metallophosphoesterase [Chloroflexota bacterium]
MTQGNGTLSFPGTGLLQLLGGLAAASIATVAYSRLVEPRWVDVEAIDLHIAGLPERQAGKRIAHLSDIHLCDFTGPEGLAEAITIINPLAPDWIFLTGDYVGDHARDAEGMVEPLRRAQAPIYAVFGNHDYWSDVRIVLAALEEAGVHVLRNQATQIANDLWLAGVDDIWGGRPDLNVALQGIPSGATTLLMVHEPDFFDLVIQREAPVAVQFSGHSHGGQVRLPLLRPGRDGLYTYAPILPRFGRRYPIGLRQVGGRQVYTSRGLGMWPAPYRLNCRPEITIFTLLPGEI